MENAVRQRIIELTSAKENPSLTSIGRSSAEKMQLSRQINGSTSISLLTVLLILEKIPNVSAEWLLRGEGEMYKHTENTIPIPDDYVLQHLFELLKEKDKQIALLQEQNQKALDIIHELEKRRNIYKSPKSSDNNDSVDSNNDKYESVPSKMNFTNDDNENDTANEQIDKSKVNMYHSKINNLNVL